MYIGKSMVSEQIYFNRYPEGQEIDMSIPKILFLCTGNSCRSQMAEGLAKHFRGDVLEAYSAGIETHGMNPNAVAVMRELGIDILKDQRSKLFSDIAHVGFDYVISVCGHADENCPVLPLTCTKVHHGFDDPPKLAKTAASEEEALGHYRRVRDEIKEYILTLPQSLPGGKA